MNGNQKITHGILPRSKHIKEIAHLIKTKDDVEPKRTYKEIVQICKSRWREGYTTRQLYEYKRKHIDTPDEFKGLMRKKIMKGMKVLNILEEREQMINVQKKRIEAILAEEDENNKKRRAWSHSTEVVRELSFLNKLTSDYREDLQSLGVLEFQAKTIIKNQMNIVSKQSQQIVNIKELSIETRKKIADLIVDERMESRAKKAKVIDA